MKAHSKFASRLLLGTLAVAMVTACSPESPKLKGFQSAEKVTTNEAANFNPRVDILFVVDNSGSMGTLQDNLSANIPKFVAEIQKSPILDYHIGVVTATIDETYSCGKACDGKLYSKRGQDMFVTKKTPDALEQLADNLLVGTDGGGQEKFFAPVMAALSPPLSTGINADFYRPDGTLVVIFLTDADDQTNGVDADDYLKFVWGLKQGDTKKVLTYGVAIPLGYNPTGTCSRSGEPDPVKITEAVKKSGGLMFNVCDPDFGSQVGQLATDVAQKVSKTLYLNRAPDVKSIVVTYGSQVIANDRLKGWTYVPAKNALEFGDELVLTEQPEGTTLTVNFNAARYEVK